MASLTFKVSVSSRILLLDSSRIILSSEIIMEISPVVGLKELHGGEKNGAKHYFPQNFRADISLPDVFYKIGRKIPT